MAVYLSKMAATMVGTNITAARNKFTTANNEWYTSNNVIPTIHKIKSIVIINKCTTSNN